MSVVSLQRPLLLQLHLPSQLQLAVSPFCISSRYLSASALGGARRGSGVKQAVSTCTRVSNLGFKRKILIGGRHFSARGENARLPWSCVCQSGIQNSVRKSSRVSPLVTSKVVDMDTPGTDVKASGKRRPSTGPKQLALREVGVHGNTFISFVQILGTGLDTEDTAPSVLLFFDKRRIIFNAGEGLQRFCIEHKVKLSKLDHVFLTRVCSETASGLPGLLLTLSNTGDAGMAINLWGPSDLNFLVDAMRTFIPASSVVHARSFGEALGKATEGSSRGSPKGSPKGDASVLADGDSLMLFEDEVVRISAVVLQPDSSGRPAPVFRIVEGQRVADAEDNKTSPRKTIVQSSETKVLKAEIEGFGSTLSERQEVASEGRGTSHLNGSSKRLRLDSSGMAPSSLPGGGIDSDGFGGSKHPIKGVHGPRHASVVYICELAEIIGKFDPKKARALGLRPGPKYGQLQAGNSVLRDDEKKTVHPRDVMDPPFPGPVCLIVDCPTISHVASLVSARGLERFLPKADGKTTRTDVKKVTCMIHIGPASVVNSAVYREWMKQFDGTEHIMAGHGLLCNVSPVMKASARVMSRLNYLCPQVFPVVDLEQGQDKMDTDQASTEYSPSVTMAQNLLKFRLRPISSAPFDRSSVPTPLDAGQTLAELVAENGDLKKASRDVAELWDLRPGALSNSVDKSEDLLASISREGSSDDNVPSCVREATRQEMEMVFLGTGSSQPSKYRNVSAIHIHLFNRGGLLLDCGEGTYGQLKRRYGNEAADNIVAGLVCVWISHIHADHHTGLARILSIRKQILEHEGRFEPILVIGPKQLKRYLDAYRRLEDLGMDFLDCSQTTVFADSAASSMESSDGVTAESLSDKQKVQGGLISLPSRKLQVEERSGTGLRNYWLQSGFNLQAGVDERGREKLKETLAKMGLSQLISVPVVHCPHAFGVVLVAKGKKLLEPGWKLVYSGDTRPCQALVEASTGATVLIHEATFDDSMGEEARAKSHSLTREAIETGITAGAYRTILTHFSQRYPKIPVFNESYDDRTCIAFDMMSVNLADLPQLPKILPALKVLFKGDMVIADEVADDMVDPQEATVTTS